MKYTILHTEFYRERAQPGMLVVGSDSHTCSSGAVGCLAIGLGAADVALPLELGGITGIFMPDDTTHNFINRRKLARHKCHTTYFRPDADAEYAAVHEIDLTHVGSFIARYPSPDDVVPVTEEEGMELNGCFIGACTTTEEDLVLGALVMEQAMKRGSKPTAKGKRKVVPGSMPILYRLRELGLCDIYEDAGFEIGIPGCSYCVGMSADQAAAGEVWISSQNRNFENRMGKGSIGHLASAATVAASSFEMKLVDPSDLLAAMDLSRWRQLTTASTHSDATSPKSDLIYVEPCGCDYHRAGAQTQKQIEKPRLDIHGRGQTKSLQGKVQRLGDFVNTDAVRVYSFVYVREVPELMVVFKLAPAEFLIGMKNNMDAGLRCLVHTHPKFRERAQQGFNIVVSEFLSGCGVQCVIAKSFAFIFQRNMPSLGLLGITMEDESFFQVADDGVSISIDLNSRIIDVAGKTFGFKLSQMETEIFQFGGIASAFGVFGNKLLEAITPAKLPSGYKQEESEQPDKRLQW
ncbi:hypothetical protein N7497_008448 [Penicillium chrysogenum]|nr:hypothetical protein N7497_008448 [Penicillium chrysogenum]